MKQPPWAMLAVDWDDVAVKMFPMIGQPKLDGIRAKWDGEQLVSRQGKVWKTNTLPHIYDELTSWSSKYPGVSLDGELYCHGMPFQAIESLTAVNRMAPCEGCELIKLHAFDIISSDDTETRQNTLAHIYPYWVAVCKVQSEEDANAWLHRFKEAGYEGMMLRSLNAPYLEGRTEALIKLKEWQYAQVIIVGFSPGKDGFTGTLGALEVSLKGLRFGVSSGLDMPTRAEIWNNQSSFVGKHVMIRYRDVYNSGKPKHAQIVRIK